MDINNLSWTGRLNIIKMPFFPKWMYRFQVILKCPAGHFSGMNKLLLKFTCKFRRIIVAKTILKNIDT